MTMLFNDSVMLASSPDLAAAEQRTRLVLIVGIGLSVAAPLSDAEGVISSTRIRRAMLDGFPERATAALGRPLAGDGLLHGEEVGHSGLAHRVESNLSL